MEAHSEATSDLPRVLQGSRTTLGTQHPNFFMVYSELSPLDEDTGEGDSTDSLIVMVKTLVGLYEFRPFNSATCTEVPSYASDLRSGMFRHQHLAAAYASWHEISFEKGMCLKKSMLLKQSKFTRGRGFNQSNHHHLYNKDAIKKFFSVAVA